MNLQGMTICFLGDSITEGAGCSSKNKVFHQLIAKEYGLTHAYNNGLGGTRIAPQVVPGKTLTDQDLYFSLRAQVMDKNADAVVVFGGTNDYGHGDAPFGEVKDPNPKTFCGAVRTLVEYLQKTYAGKPVVFLTPLHRRNEETPNIITGKTLAEYVSAIREICKEYAIPAIDLFEMNPLDPYDKEFVPDGLHPNDRGHEVLAKVIGEELAKL
ncbi:MAG: SGNH/GDSL hydrolase family protein [Oscillospiraceae bacterium]|nr:SGNH/GDSL hydrolase family protein [Oscillospiraceae bacterium]